MKRVFVIGAGASGLMAAYCAAVRGHAVTVIEKNEKCGKKLYITGKGRCNITNDVSVEDFLTNVVSNPRFLTGCMHSFTPQMLMRFLQEGGLPLKTERGNRVFPVSDKARDVTKCLENYCKKVGVCFIFNEKVQKIDVLQSTMSEIITDKSRYSCDACILCTGGLSYPGTGSTGDGYRFAESVGHKIIQPRAALCGINLSDNDLSELQGLSLKNISVTAYRADQKIRSFFGEMLFTHFGVSGPCILSLSSLLNRVPLREARLEIDLKPALEESVLDKRLLRDFEKYKNRYILHALTELLPRSLISVVISRSNIAADTAVHSVTKQQRTALIQTLKHFTLNPTSLRTIGEAIVTAGGVDVSEINPKTMESKLIKGLYCCGEILDVDAFTGGFNLQIAFSTGYAAGNNV